MSKQVIVMGCSISSYLCACYLKKQHPELSVKIIGQRNPKLPLVGESLTEFSTLLMHEIGLSAYLEEKQYHKYGLTFYFKEEIDNPKSRRYAVHEALQVPPIPANLINRFTFDQHLHSFTQQLGVEIIEGKISDIQIKPQARHSVTYKLAGDRIGNQEADWLIDASGRSRLLGRTLDLPKTELYSRSSFWFRLVDFDRAELSKIEAFRVEHHNFDPYYVTHHFLGRANWLWLIPVRTDTFKEMISIGLVWRPDLCDAKIKSISDFQEWVAKEHPVICDLVSSGRILDTNLFSNYLYDTPHIYSRDRWFLLGDAGDTVDPLYSTGVVMTTVQIKQISELISHSKRSDIPQHMLEDFESGYKMLRNTVQMGVHSFYEVMHDPFEAHWRMHLISTFYFFFMLPAWLAGYMSSHTGVRWFQREMARAKPDYLSLLGLLGRTSNRLGPQPASKIRNWYDLSVDWTLRSANDLTIPKSMAALWFRFVYFRAKIWRMSGYIEPMLQFETLVRNLSRAVGLWLGAKLGLNRVAMYRSLLGIKLEDVITSKLETSAYCSCGMCQVCTKLKSEPNYVQAINSAPQALEAETRRAA